MKLQCGHDSSEIISSDEGTCYCAACEREAKMANLLTNPKFDDIRRVLVPGASGTVPFGWTGWYRYLPGKRKIPWDPNNATGYVAPEFKPTSAVAPYLNPPRHINGHGQCWFGQGKHLHSGMWQKVSVPIGATLQDRKSVV